MFSAVPASNAWRAAQGNHDCVGIKTAQRSAGCIAEHYKSPAVVCTARQTREQVLIVPVKDCLAIAVELLSGNRAISWIAIDDVAATGTPEAVCVVETRHFNCGIVQ